MLRLTRSIPPGRVARASLAAALALAALFGLTALGWAAEPQPWQMNFQPPATPVMERLVNFHDWLLVITFLITIFVLGLLGYVMVRFHHTRHPLPTRTSHNPVIEILWTVVPVLILVLIAIPSFKLMYYMDRTPNADITIKVTAHQWYWSYEYPDQGGLGFDSNLIQDKDLKPGQKRLLEVDNPLVVPVDTNVRVQITGTDVIHSWFVPSFGVQEYAIIGRLNESWFRVEHEGSYYGECNQICGVNHAFMPIKVVAVSKPDFQKWLGDAKKKFAAAPPAESTPAGNQMAPAAAVVAAAAAQPGSGEPPAGN
jgi:cytochrome c oxidase subunit II